MDADNLVMSLRPHPLETLLTALSGWLPLVAGMTLVGMTVITPEWLGWRELRWQRDMLALQAKGLSEQRAGYAGFYDAVMADDPVLLERLAFTQLHIKPADKRLLDGVGNVWAGDKAVAVGGGLTEGTAWTDQGPGEIESWLAVPLPVVGRDIATLQPMNTRLTRLTGGRSRYVLLAVGMICLLAGLWPEQAGEPEAVAD